MNDSSSKGWNWLNIHFLRSKKLGSTWPPPPRGSQEISMWFRFNTRFKSIIPVVARICAITNWTAFVTYAKTSIGTAYKIRWIIRIKTTTLRIVTVNGPYLSGTTDLSGIIITECGVACQSTAWFTRAINHSLIATWLDFFHVAIWTAALVTWQRYNWSITAKLRWIIEAWNAVLRWTTGSTWSVHYASIATRSEPRIVSLVCATRQILSWCQNIIATGCCLQIIAKWTATIASHAWHNISCTTRLDCWIIALAIATCFIYGSVSTTNIIWISRWIANQATTCQARTVVESRLCAIIAACIVTAVRTNATATSQCITGYYWRTTAARLGVVIVADHAIESATARFSGSINDMIGCWSNRLPSHNMSILYLAKVYCHSKLQIRCCSLWLSQHCHNTNHLHH